MEHLELIDLVHCATKKHQVKFTYGDDDSTRTVNPHCIYTLNDTIYLDAFQVAGATNSNINQWKQFKVDKIKDVIELDTEFEVEDTFNPCSKRYLERFYSVVHAI